MGGRGGGRRYKREKGGTGRREKGGRRGKER